jgi:hypothetical protein
MTTGSIRIHRVLRAKPEKVYELSSTLTPLPDGSHPFRAVPSAIPLEMCYLGWQESIAQLVNLVEPDIPG